MHYELWLLYFHSPFHNYTIVIKLPFRIFPCIYFNHYILTTLRTWAFKYRYILQFRSHISFV